MKKPYIALILIILFSLVYFSIFGIQTLSTDKKVYAIGEEIEIHYSDFRLEFCICTDKVVQIFKDEQRIQYIMYSMESLCVDGRIQGFPMRCDMISCSFPKLDYSKVDFKWDLKLYERTGPVDSCTLNNEVINRTWMSYELKNASAGKYKIKYGNAVRVIEII